MFTLFKIYSFVLISIQLLNVSQNCKLSPPKIVIYLCQINITVAKVCKSEGGKVQLSLVKKCGISFEKWIYIPNSRANILFVVVVYMCKRERRGSFYFNPVNSVCDMNRLHIYKTYIYANKLSCMCGDTIFGKNKWLCIYWWWWWWLCG